MSTRAIKYLEKEGIPFDVIKYEHHEKGAEFAAKAARYPLERTVKTLVTDLGDKHYALVLMPGDRQLSLKRLADVCKVKRAAMADAMTAERLTGYLVGGISPFGTKQRLPVIMEEQVSRFDEILINAGQRGIMLKMDPNHIQAALSCRIAAVAEE